jgi:hypothetical protein
MCREQVGWITPHIRHEGWREKYHPRNIEPNTDRVEVVSESQTAVIQ